MRRTKILVCGSTGFLMSNFLRYILYRSSDFDVTGIDVLSSPNDIRKVYVHHRHTFYPGNVLDSRFMNIICEFVKPDFIINGVRSPKLANTIDSVESIVKSAACLKELNTDAKIIQMSVSEDVDDHGLWASAEKITLSSGGSVLRIPNCFGWREKLISDNQVTISIPNVIYDIINDFNPNVTKDKVPFAYAEDIASLLWYMVENKTDGIVTMPPLGNMSYHDIAKHFIKKYEKDVVPEEVEHYCNSICKKYESNTDNIPGWRPDSKSLVSSLNKTFKWYNANRWALSIS